MKSTDAKNWPNEFSFEGLDENSINMEATGYSAYSEAIMDDSYEALNRFYQKETKRSKATPKRRKHAWQ